MADVDISQYIDPNAYAQAQQAKQQANALAYAQMRPEERTAMAGYNFGGALGKAAGGLFGIKDRGLEEVTAANEIMKGVDRQDPKAMYEAAKTLGQQGYMKAGEAVFRQAQLLEERASKLAEQGAKTEYEKARAATAANPLGRINPQMYTPESLAKYKQSLDIGDLVLVEKAQQAQSMAGKLAQDRGFKPGTPEFTNEVAKIEAAQQAEKQAKAQQVKAMPASIRKEVDALQEQVDVFSNNISDVSNIVKLLDENKVKFSPGDNLESFLRTVFNNSDEASRVKSDLRSSVEGMRNAILQGNKGTQTEGDAQRAADEILSAIDKNDTATVYRRLQVLQTKFDRAMQQRKKRLDNYYSAYGEKTPGGADIAPEAAPMQATTPAATQAPKFSGIKTPLDVRAAVKAGNMSREDAKAILKDMEAQGIFK